MSKENVVYIYKNPLTIVANILAVMVSWYYNHSILWAIFHFFFGWLYLLYSLLIGRFADGGFMEIMSSYF